jgi:hypothetical protein
MPGVCHTMSVEICARKGSRFRRFLGLKIMTDSILVQDDLALSSELGETAVVLGIHAGSYFDFNRIGTEIWNMLAEPCRVERIFDTLLRVHDVDVDIMKHDVIAFLQVLIDNHLVRAGKSGENR